MEYLISQYKNKLERKKRLIKPLIDKKNSIEGFDNLKDELEYTKLYAEIQILEKIIDDLEYIK